MTSLFQLSTSLSSSAIFQHHQRMEFTFHNSYVILVCVHSTLIFWTVPLLMQKLLKQGYVAPWLTSSLKKILYGRHHNLVDLYKISISQISNKNGSFTFYVDVFFPLSVPRLLPDLTVYMSNAAGVLYEAGTAYFLRKCFLSSISAKNFTGPDCIYE
jgi:hypothetical protein